MILNQIVKKRKEQLDWEVKNVPLEKILDLSSKTSINTKDFKSAITSKDSLSIIAEIKKASPSKGLIKSDFNPTLMAKKYEQYGAKAISVLTEEFYFRGSKDYLINIRKYVDLPILRKDFIIDKYQIYESKVIGADAILLITSLLNLDKLIEYISIAKSLGLYCLTEVHNENELELALKSNADIIGINNRDLNTFYTDISTTTSLSKLIPSNCTLVSESGIKNRSHVKTIYESGANAVLIGETLMKSTDIESTFKSLKYPFEAFHED